MTGGRRIGLDFLRALAALTVVFAHGGLFFYALWPAQEILWLLASWGVDLFFALSGFLIGGILLDAPRRGLGWVWNFWNRRWLRTLPNYFLFLVINLGLAWLATRQWPDFRLHLVFAQNLAWSPSPFFPESWSLAIEEVFYLLAPIVFVLAGVSAKRPFRSAAVLLALLLLAHCLRWEQILQGAGWHEGVKKIAVARVDAILYGVIVALGVRWLRPDDAQARMLAILSPLCLTASAYLFLRANADADSLARLWCFTLSGVGFAALLPIFSSYAVTISEHPGIRCVRALAAWSFALYLTHLPIMRLLDLIQLPRDNWFSASMHFLIYLAVSLAIAAMVYRYVEAPILRWRDRRFPAIATA